MPNNVKSTPHFLYRFAPFHASMKMVAHAFGEANRCVAVVFVVLICSACATSSRTESVPLTSELAVDPAQLSCQRLPPHAGEPTFLYSCTSGSEQAFLTVVRDCVQPDKLTYQASTRQLLVGFADLRIVRQEPLALGNHSVLRTVVLATLDASPVIAATFTQRVEGCLIDVVVWRAASTEPAPSERHPTPHPPKAELVRFTELATRVATPFLKTVTLTTRSAEEVVQ
jgi:hypothetical protein